MYPQFPQQYPQSNPTRPIVPQFQQHQSLRLPNTQNPLRPTQLPTQLVANPNNITTQSTYDVEIQTLPTYVITSLPIHQVQLRSIKVLQQKKPTVVIEEELEEEETPSQSSEKKKFDNVIVISTPIAPIPSSEQQHLKNTPKP